MVITLCVNMSATNKIGKSLASMTAYEGTLREECSAINPVVLMQVDNPTGYNYGYIPDFGRYYYITDMVSVRTGLWRISFKVDVLESFRNEIISCSVILSDTENTGAETYLSGRVWKSKVKQLTDIMTFPSGLSESGHFILITAGG